MWPRFDSLTWLHMWVEFVGSLFCSERVLPGCSGSPPSLLKNLRLISFESIYRVPNLGTIFGFMCGLSLLVLYSSLRGFSPVAPVPPPSLLKNLRLISFESIYRVPNLGTIFGFMCGLSLLVLYSALRGFSPVAPVPPLPPQKPTFDFI